MKTHVLTTLAIASLGVVGGYGGPVHGIPSTVDGFYTWDADMVNIEKVSQTGKGVYVAMLDTGLVPNWTDYLPKERVATQLGIGFDQQVVFKVNKEGRAYEVEVGPLKKTSFIGTRGTSHGTHTTSTILGYFYRSNSDAAGGYPLPPLIIRGIAPEVTIIPVKVLADYQVPALPHARPPTPSYNDVFGTDQMIAAGINYVTDLAIKGYQPMVISMSLGGPELADIEKAAIDRAIANGVIIVASAGNEGLDGLGYPAAYPPVISAGSAGWVGEWWQPDMVPPPDRYRLWWLQSPFYPYNDVTDPTDPSDVYVSDFSSRQLDGQELDVLAPGSWVRGPLPGVPGYSHLPWWSHGIGDLRGHNPGNFYYVGGTSMAVPHVSGLAALILQKHPSMNQAQIEALLKSTALPIPPGSATVWDVDPAQGWYLREWDSNATGAGLIDAAEALK